MGRWLLALLLMSASLCAAVPDDQDIDVKVAKSGDLSGSRRVAASKRRPKRSLEGADRLRRYGPVCFDIGIQQDHPQGGKRTRRCAKGKSPLPVCCRFLSPRCVASNSSLTTRFGRSSSRATWPIHASQRPWWTKATRR